MFWFVYVKNQIIYIYIKNQSAYFYSKLIGWFLYRKKFIFKCVNESYTMFLK